MAGIFELIEFYKSIHSGLQISRTLCDRERSLKKLVEPVLHREY